MRRRASWAWAVLAAFVLALALPAAASADPPAPDAPPAMDAAPPIPQSPATPATAPRKTSELEKMLHKNPASLAAVILLKYVLAAVGVALLILAYSRFTAVRRGLVPPPPARGPPTPAASVPVAIGIVLGTALLTGLVGEGLRRTRPEGASTPLWAAILATVGPQLLAVGAFFVLRRRAEGLSGQRPVPARRAVAAALWSLCAFSAIGLVVALVWSLVIRVTSLPEDPQPLVLRMFEGPLDDAILIATFGTFVAPFTEECLFRGLLYGSVRAVTKPVVAALAVSLVFAAVHGNWQALGPLVALACMLSWLYERTGSIVAVTLCHALFNATFLVPALLFRLT